MWQLTETNRCKTLPQRSITCHTPSAMAAFWSEVCGVYVPFRCRGCESAMRCRANASVECATQHSAPSVRSRPADVNVN